METERSDNYNQKHWESDLNSDCVPIKWSYIQNKRSIANGFDSRKKIKSKGQQDNDILKDSTIQRNN